MKSLSLTRVMKLLRSSDSPGERHREKWQKPLPPRDGKKQELRDQESNIKRQETWPRLRDGRLCPQFLPHEDCNSDVLECVADYLSLDDLRNLRLVNGTMYDATIRLFVRRYFKFQTVEFTLHGLQRMIDISKHQDLSKTVLFGNRICFISFTQAVWSEKEAGTWFLRIFKSSSWTEKRALAKGALKARKLWHSHKKMITRKWYLPMLKALFESLNGSGQFQGFDFMDPKPEGHNGVDPGTMWKDDQMRMFYLPTDREKATRFAFTMEICFNAMRATNTFLLQGFRRPDGNFGYERNHVDLRQLTGMMDRHEATSGSVPPWQFLERCTLLGLDFATVYPWEKLSLNDQHSFTRLITPMSQTLTVLTLHASCYRGVLQNVIHELDQHVFMPNLKSLTLDRGTTDYKDLFGLLAKHSNSLQNVHLLYLELSYNTWNSFFLTLANTPMPKLDELWIHYPREGNVKLWYNNTYGSTHVRWITWPSNWKVDNSAIYPRMFELFGNTGVMTYADSEVFRQQTTRFQFVRQFGLVGVRRLCEMAAGMVFVN
ncbi:hypothetical protein EG328_008659 [Venturia inaequalis]|uniref:F-box domain-containing protein n=1 Tax=Venturia inaequalis TaxID=5025 RepID=A0A8H3UA58_VENIN|nr:hypothetical protein EG328_008659 [Venturia inaequalis]